MANGTKKAVIPPEISAEVYSRTVPKFLVIGECGDGKSTLINAIVGESVAQSGRVPGGVTKELAFYLCNVMSGIIIDTPGVGDSTIRPPELLAMMGEAFQVVDVHGVIVCSKEYNRVKMGGQLVSRFVDMAFKSNTKWDNVIFAWTHADKADEEEIANLRACVDECMGSIGAAGQRPRICVTKCPPRDDKDVSQLVEACNAIAQQAGIGKFTNPSSTDVAKAISEVTGADFHEALQQLEKMKAELEADRKRLQDQLKEIQERHEQQLEQQRKAHEQLLKQLQDGSAATLKQITESNAQERAAAMENFSTMYREAEDRNARTMQQIAEQHRAALAEVSKSRGGCVIS